MASDLHFDAFGRDEGVGALETRRTGTQPASGKTIIDG